MTVSRRRTTTVTLLLFFLVAGACGGGAGPGQPAPAEPPEPEPVAPAPWSAAPLDSSAVAAPYLDAWRSAENRESCALLAFTADAPGDPADAATPRAARFGGGWGVAWDLPETRSAYGVAGTGTEPGPDTYDDWPYHREWRDGSTAGYGPEGGRGPNQLAYLQVAGQRCLYNVWSRLGVDHLERLLEGLRFVEGAR